MLLAWYVLDLVQVRLRRKVARDAHLQHFKYYLQKLAQKLFSVVVINSQAVHASVEKRLTVNVGALANVPSPSLPLRSPRTFLSYFREFFHRSRASLLESLGFAKIRQTANARERKILRNRAIRVMDLLFSKLQCIIILLTRRRQYKMKKLNENLAKKVALCVCRCSKTGKLNSLFLTPCETNMTAGKTSSFFCELLIQFILFTVPGKVSEITLHACMKDNRM